MPVHTPLSEVLHSYLPDKTNLHQLARDADIPLATLHHWLSGHVKRPHTWQPLLKLAAALNLDVEQTDRLLTTARHPPLSQLASRPQQDKDLELLAHWAHPSHRDFPLHNLSLGRLTSCIGREDALDAIGKRLSKVRMLTLTGPGGCGKTRLGLEVAGRALSMFPDGVFFVDLAPVSEPHLVLTMIAQALSLTEKAGTPINVRLETYLRDCHLLLILDNFEHLIAAAPDVVNLLLAAPRLTILVTSRTLLRVAGEQEWEVKPLSVPEPNLAFEQICANPAVALFVERAQAARHEFMITPENAGVVVELCRRVDGLPLGIELAAARSRMFSPQEILEQLPHSLRLHQRGMDTVPERHRSLDALLDWSYALLDPLEQALFRRLSVFAGDFTIPAVQAVCIGTQIAQQDSVELLTQLVDQSLVQVEQQAGFVDTRYRMLETIRQYSLAKLVSGSEAATLHARHRDWYLALAIEAREQLTGAEQQRWLQRLDLEYTNLRAALEWNSTAEGDPLLQLRFVVALWRYWETRSMLSEGLGWHTSIIDHHADLLQDAAHTVLWAKLLCGAGTLAYGLGDTASALQYYERSLTMFRKLGDQRGSAEVLTHIGVMKHYEGEFQHATDLFDQSLRLYQELDDHAGLAWTYTTLGDIAHVQGDYPRARELFERSRALWQQLGNNRNVAWLTKNLGTIACDQGNYAHAQTLFDESMRMFQDVGDQLGICYAFINLGRLARYQGQAKQARTLLEHSLKLIRAIGDRLSSIIVLNHLGGVARDQGDDPRARALFSEALNISEQLGNKWMKAWALNDLGDIARDHNDAERAIALYRESLALREAMDDRVGIAYVLESLAELCCLRPDTESMKQAAALWSAADGIRIACGIPLPDVEARRHRPIVAAARERLDAKTWNSAWQWGRQVPLDQLTAAWDSDDPQDRPSYASSWEEGGYVS